MYPPICAAGTSLILPGSSDRRFEAYVLNSACGSRWGRTTNDKAMPHKTSATTARYAKKIHFTLRIGSNLSRFPPRVEHVAQSVADEVQTQQCDGQQHA